MLQGAEEAINASVVETSGVRGLVQRVGIPSHHEGFGGILIFTRNLGVGCGDAAFTGTRAPLGTEAHRGGDFLGHFVIEAHHRKLRALVFLFPQLGVKHVQVAHFPHGLELRQNRVIERSGGQILPVIEGAGQRGVAVLAVESAGFQRGANLGRERSRETSVHLIALR